MPSDILLTSDDVRTLVDIGFIALSAGALDKAATIFEGVREARPHEEAGFIGMALVHLAQGDAQAAVQLLKPLPPSDAVMTFLGLALTRLGARDDARDLLSAVANTPGGSPHAATAAALLAELG